MKLLWIRKSNTILFIGNSIVIPLMNTFTQENIEQHFTLYCTKYTHNRRVDGSIETDQITLALYNLLFFDGIACKRNKGDNKNFSYFLLHSVLCWDNECRPKRKNRIIKHCRINKKVFQRNSNLKLKFQYTRAAASNIFIIRIDRDTINWQIQINFIKTQKRGKYTQWSILNKPPRNFWQLASYKEIVQHNGGYHPLTKVLTLILNFKIIQRTAWFFSMGTPISETEIKKNRKFYLPKSNHGRIPKSH